MMILAHDVFEFLASGYKLAIGSVSTRRHVLVKNLAD
jgi:hypothetical protein